MAKAIVWVRTSTEEQEVDTQKTLLTEKAKKDNFKEEDLVYIGVAGASAIKMNELYQREVNELLGKIQTDPDITAVYVWEVSRLARNELAFYQMKDALIGRHIQLVCDVPSIRLLDDDGEVNTGAELSLNLLVTLAKQEMTIKKKRMSRGKKRLAEQGKYNGGAIPFGYRIDTENDNLIVPDEGGEADVVREIFNLYEQGLSQPKIARELYNRGLRGRSTRPTNTFTMSLVHQVLTNRLLTGAPNLNKGSSYERTYPMIITPEQFERCRRIAEKNNTKAPKALQVYYAHRLIQCQDCGRFFVSTGNKGYYHCWDAYYTNHDINGYPNASKCSNRLCISVNIMDSLLWALAIEYETMFIVSSSLQKIRECELAKTVIEQKLAALPLLREELEGKMDNLLDALAEGMKKDRFNTKKANLMKEGRQLDADEAYYKEQLARYDAIIAETRKYCDTEYDMGDFDDLDTLLAREETIRARVAAINDDKERSRIIHKHIEKVVLEETTINYVFGIHPNGKEAWAKRILIYFYGDKEPSEFAFLPYNGKGGVMLYKNINGGQTIGGRVVPQYEEFVMEYLPRIIDRGKIIRRAAEKEKREEARNKEIAALKRNGYISIREMMEYSHRSYSTLYKAIKDGKMNGINRNKTWYVKKADFEHYLQEYVLRPTEA